MKNMKALIYPKNAARVERLSQANKRSYNFTVNELLEQALKPVRKLRAGK